MRVVVAPGRFEGELGAGQAAAAIAEGWATAAPRDDLVLAPVGDGGPGLVADLHAALGGRLTPLVVPLPGGPVPAALLLLEDGTAVVEAADVLGPALADRDTSSAAVHHLLAGALASGAGRVVVGLGGVVAHDAGAGLLHALGGGSARLDRGAAGLPDLGPDDVRGVVDVGPWPCELVGAADVEVPLLGLHGASALLAVAPVPGAEAAPPDETQGLERGFAHLVHLLGGELGPGRVRAAASGRGAGAGGGLGFALTLLGGDVRDGAAVSADLLGLDALVAGADLVLTGVGALDPHALHGTGLSAAAASGLAGGVPVVALARQVLLGRREVAASGLAGAYAVAETLDALDAAAADPAAAVRALAARVARTWSR